MNTENLIFEGRPSQWTNKIVKTTLLPFSLIILLISGFFWIVAGLAYDPSFFMPIVLLTAVLGRIFAFVSIPPAMKVTEEKNYNDGKWIALILVVPLIAVIMAWAKISTYNSKIRYANDDRRSNSKASYSRINREVRVNDINKGYNYEEFARVMHKQLGRIPSPDSSEYKEWLKWKY